MFDVTQQIDLTVENREIPGGTKRCRVHWPSEEQWLRYNSRLHLVTKPGEGGVGAVSEIEGDAAAEEELFYAILVEQEPELDVAERAEVVDRLQWQRLREVQRMGDEVVIGIGVPGGETVHRLAVPTAAEKKAYRNSIPAARELGRGKTVMPLSIVPQAKFYDVLSRGVEGYTGGGVPPIHKATAVRALLALVDQSSDDRDFF